MAEVKLIDITKKFGDVPAVDLMNLTVHDRDFLVLVGPSGCGKSTTLQMIAGIEDPSSGEIRINDRLVNDVAPKDRDIAMVFQNYALYPHMTVYKNMAFCLKMKKYPKEEIKKRVQEAARILNLEELLKRKPRELSGGQRQRVAMGRAIVRKPQVFLFDEPLSNLDAKLRVQMRWELAQLHDRLETTVIYVTHDQIEAMTLATRIVIMNQGRIMQIGSPLEVYNFPDNLFVAGFIGSPAMNFMDADLVRENGGLSVRINEHQLPLPDSLKNRFEKALGRQVVFGLRPEFIYDLNLKEPFPGAVRIAAEVKVVEPIGSQVILLSTFGSNTVTAAVDPQTDARPRTPIELLFDMNKMHLFDRETEEAY